MTIGRAPLRADGESARLSVEYAKQAGILPRYPERCEVCAVVGEWKSGVWTIVLHHHSYEIADHLSVTPLCRSCHRRVHSGSIPEPRTGEVRTGGRRHDTTPRRFRTARSVPR